MKRKQILLILLMALMVPSATWAQVQSTDLGPNNPSYETNFDTQTDWIPRNDVVNGWCIDDAIYHSRDNSLYATATPAPNSSHPEYYFVGTDASYSYMTHLFFMEAGVYQVDYYYRGGHDYLFNNNSYPRVALVEGNPTITAGHDLNYSIGNSSVIYLDLCVDNSNPSIPLTRILPYIDYWERHTETITIPENGLYTLVFALEIPASTPSGYAWIMAFDDLSIQYIQPYNLTVSDVDHLSANLSWESLDADSWEVQYRRTSPSTSEWIQKTNLTSRHCTLDNLPTLAETTTIEVRVRANFSNGLNSAWVTTQFTALRTPNTTYPYSTDFNNSNEDADWYISPVTFYQTQYGNEYCTETFGIGALIEPHYTIGDRSLHVWNSLYADYNLRYFQRDITEDGYNTYCYAKKSFNLTRGDYTIAFNWAGQGDEAHGYNSSGDFLGVFLAPVGADLNVILDRMSRHYSNEGVISIANLLNKDYFVYNRSFSTSFSIDTETAGDYWLVFAWFNDLVGENPTTPRYAFAVDNLTLDRTTTFPVPTDLAVSPSVNSATFSWMGQESASSYTLQYKEASASSWTTVTPTTNPYTLTGLTNNTNYVAQLRINYDNNSNHSEWVAFDPFKTLLQDAVSLNATNTSYYEDFQNGNGNWMFINSSDISGEPVNRWRRFSVMNLNYGDLGYGLRVTYSADNSFTTSWSYRKRRSYTIGGQTNYLETPATSYAVKTFALGEGHYEFAYNYAVKGIAGEDYMRVVLVPAETVIEAGVLPEGFSYNSTPEGWVSLDGGQQLVGDPNNNDYYGWTEHSPVSLDVYPGGTCEPGNYMMVILWKNAGSIGQDGQNPPGAIDNVSITWSELLTPPTGIIVGEESDTYAILSWTAPASGLTPTGYEVQYEPLGNNNFVDAPIVATNTTSATLMGLTAHTNYQVRVRSVYTANGNSIYSDWTSAVAISTLYPRPTNLAVVDQTTSWIYVEWTPVTVDLDEGEYINYWWQLTQNLNDWGDYIGQGQVSPSWTQNLAPGTYYFHVKTAVYGSEGYLGESNWSEPLAFTIAPWNDPVTIFPFVEDFEEYSDRFADGLTLGGDFEHLDVTSHTAIGVPAPEGDENEYALRFHSCNNKTAYLVLPPLRPSTSDALVSFWWYHDNSGSVNEGVAVEHSSDGSSWTSFGTMISRYAEQSGWVKYHQVVPATGTNPIYIRLRFYGSNTNQWTRCCYLDDLTVNNFKSYQPYISYVGCNGTTATITLYDYAYENGWPSSAFQVQYREYREPGQTQEAWETYSLFANTTPAFGKTLTVEGLQPTTLYEFRACARVSYSTFDFPWSDYCEPYRQWTDCGTHTISPTHSFTMEFEDEFYVNCWTADEGWTMQHEGGYNSSYCAYIPAGAYNNRMTSPAFNFDGCDNVIMRFWTKGAGYVRVRYGENLAHSRLLYSQSNAADWVQVEVSLSYFMDKAPIQIYFEPITGVYREWYVDDIEIEANVYDKVFDVGGYSYAGEFAASSLWYPSGAPTAEDEVMVMATARVGLNETSVSNATVGKVRFSSCGSLLVNPLGTLTATEIDAAKNQFIVKGTANVTTLNLGAANAVVVNNGGVLNAATITGTNGGANDRVVIKDGGQVKTSNAFYGTIEKAITGYGAENVDGREGWYLVASPTQVIVNETFVPKSGNNYLFDQMDFYWFNGSADLEWVNAKCALEGGCEGPTGTIPQGQISAVLGQPKKGYLYARQDDGTLQIVAGPVGNMPFPATDVDADVTLSFASNSTAPFNGWNLVGNPFTCDAYLTQNETYVAYYRMNEAGDAIVLASSSDPIKPCEGVFVQRDENVSTHTATFTSTAPSPSQGMNFSLHKAHASGGDDSTLRKGSGAIGATTLDRARIQFGEGQNLGHLDLMADPNRLYFPMKDKELAVIKAKPVGELPLNFEAADNGTFTIDFENETEELAYCHLVDNLTGADVDLLATPSYTFESHSSDYASRFKVVFASSVATQSEDEFAFYYNGKFIIANEGEATLQVVDILGRILNSERLNGSTETRIDAAPGIYVLRLLQGDQTRTQKIIVK